MSAEHLLQAITIFTLACFVGFEVISKVPPLLHTPLTSGANAISGITILGALVAASATDSPLAKWLGFVAIVLATINVVGGFLVTHRMLMMFVVKKKKAGASTLSQEPSPGRSAATLSQGERG